MKRAITLLIALSFLSTIAWSAETKKVSNTEVLETRNDFQKFYDRLKISYFGVLTTPTLKDMSDGEWENGALSPEFSGGTNRDTWPTNMWNQVSFNYNFGAKMNFVFNPRWMTPLAHPVDMQEPEDRSLIALEDFLVGFQGVVASSEDKKFNLWIRPGLRLPTSRASRNSNNAGFGQLTHQLELAFLPTYDFNKTVQVGMFGQVRSWIYEDRYNISRLRISTSPMLQITLDDTTKWVTYYNHILENNKRFKSINGKNPVFKDVWQGVMTGISKDVTKKLNIYPYVEAFVNDVPFSTNSVYVGAWISYSIK
ncbi:MAG TPA: hypothetical protein VNJ01_16945 [Bacteriovoracaceae bacterium]|nr:hypothetical protein [Bacteriovoracaceae bacterium]